MRAALKICSRAIELYVEQLRLAQTGPGLGLAPGQGLAQGQGLVQGQRLIPGPAPAPAPGREPGVGAVTGGATAVGTVEEGINKKIVMMAADEYKGRVVP